jgi:hypothetical protein
MEIGSHLLSTRTSSASNATPQSSCPIFLDGYGPLRRSDRQIGRQIVAVLSRTSGNQHALDGSLRAPIPDAVEFLNLHRIHHSPDLDWRLRLPADVAALFGIGEVFRRLSCWNLATSAAAFLHVEVARDIFWNTNSRRHGAPAPVGHMTKVRKRTLVNDCWWPVAVSRRRPRLHRPRTPKTRNGDRLDESRGHRPFRPGSGNAQPANPA